MIAALHGTVLEKNEDEAIIEVAGVGYRVAFSVLTLARLPRAGEPVRVRVRTVVREDALELYGFLTPAEETMFALLTSVSHVGPKLGMTVLSGLEVDELVAALERGEVARLTRIHGVGRKTAERLVLELKDKVKVLPRAAAGPAAGPRADGPRADSDLGAGQPRLPADAGRGRGRGGTGEAPRRRARGAVARGAPHPAHDAVAGGTLTAPSLCHVPRASRSRRPRREAPRGLAAAAQLRAVRGPVHRGREAQGLRRRGPGAGGCARPLPLLRPARAGKDVAGPHPRRRARRRAARHLAALRWSGRETSPGCSPTSSRGTSSSSTRSTASPPPVEEYLYPAMEDFRLDITIDSGPAARAMKIDLPPFTLVGATTRTGLLTSPLRDRFQIQERLEYYAPADLETILDRSARHPRRAAGRGRGEGDRHPVPGDSPHRQPPAAAHPRLRRGGRGDGESGARWRRGRSSGWRWTASGLDPMDRKILLTILEKFGGGPVGVDTIAASVGEQRDTVEDVYEPFLMQEGFLHRTPRGRVATARCWRYFDKPPPADVAGGAVLSPAEPRAAAIPLPRLGPRGEVRFARDFFRDLVRDSQPHPGLSAERERWLRSCRVEGREERLFEFEMLLRAMERYFKLHNLPIDSVAAPRRHPRLLARSCGTCAMRWGRQSSSRAGCSTRAMTSG